MIVQLGSAYKTASMAAAFSGQRQESPVPVAKNADTVSISDAARRLLIREQAEETGGDPIDARLAAINATPLSQRTPEDFEYQRQHDTKLAAIAEKQMKQPGSLTSAEMDYWQKASGFTNTMAHLNSQERALYDQLAAEGNREAIAALNRIGLLRDGGKIVGGADLTSYDPTDMPITAENIEKFFSQSFSDPNGDVQRQFDALAAYLRKHAPAS